MLRISRVISALALSMAGLALCLTPAISDVTEETIVELNSGDLIALQRSASQGDFSAILRLGEIYDDENFEQRDVEKACNYFIRATERAEKFDRFHPEASRLAAAFRRAADCYIEGVGTPNGAKDVNMAGKLLFHSGAILEDAESLFRLGRMFLAADGIGPNLGMATRLLDNAARKQYPPAQALLGSMMWEGKVTKHEPVAGLALLILGKERTHAKDRAWITTLHDEAILTAAKDVEREARQLVEKWKAVHSNTIPTAAQIAIPTPSKAPTRKLDGDSGMLTSNELVKKTKESHSPASADAVPGE